MRELCADCPPFTSQWAEFVEILPSRAAELPFKTIALFFSPKDKLRAIMDFCKSAGIEAWVR